ncbi:MAG: sulfotransferase [Bacteroidetes bacterium]|nr:sulfotransferase [Bacteroidota bacterium]
MTTQNTEAEKLYFIIGIGRSGTSILNKMLNGLRDVHCMPEAIFLVFFLSRFRHKSHFRKEDIECIFDQIYTYGLSHPWVGWSFDAVVAKEDIYERLQKQSALSFGEICLVIYRHFRVQGYDKSSAKVLVDKNPSSTIFTDEILEQYPNTRFIWMVRDYRANILSRKQSASLRSPDVAYNAMRWRLYNTRAYRFSRRHPDRVLLVRYEELVSEYQLQMAKITSFLGVSSDQETAPAPVVDIDAHNVAEKYRERFSKKYSDLNRPVNADRLYSWKQHLSESEIMICDAICGKIAMKLGYEPVTDLPFYVKMQVFCRHLPSIIRGYADILKDRILYKLPGSWKLKRLKKKYTEFGFIEK